MEIALSVVRVYKKAISSAEYYEAIQEKR